MSDETRRTGPTEEESREVAEAAREAEWAAPSFVRELFLGRFRLDLIHPYPRQSDEDRKKTDAYLERLSAFLEENVDSEEIDRTGELPPDVVDGLRELHGSYEERQIERTADDAVRGMLVEDRALIVFVGKLIPQKGVHLLLAAMFRYFGADTGRSRVVVVGADDPATTVQMVNGSQIRSTSAFDIPERSASATATPAAHFARSSAEVSSPPAVYASGPK